MKPLFYAFHLYLDNNSNRTFEKQFIIQNFSVIILYFPDLPFRPYA